MADKFQNKYRIPSARLQNWDYGRNAAYFITICTKNREHFFGEITNGKIKLSPIGAIADILWYEIKNHAKNVKLDAFVLMPNHVHGILILDGDNVDNDIGKFDGNNRIGDIGNGNNNGDGNIDDISDGIILSDGDDISDGDDLCNGDDISIVQTLHATSLQDPPREKNYQMASISPKPNSLSTIIRSYKSAVSKHAHRLGFEFAWHPRFYDHIIRNDISYNRIQQYIKNNPAKWDNDKFYNE